MADQNGIVVDLDLVYAALLLVQTEQNEAKERKAKRDEEQAIRDGVTEAMREILVTMNNGIRQIVAATAQADDKAAKEDRLGKAIELLESLPIRTAQKTMALLDEAEKAEGRVG